MGGRDKIKMESKMVALLTLEFGFDRNVFFSLFARYIVTLDARVTPEIPLAPALCLLGVSASA